MNWKVLVPFLLNSIFTIEQLGASNELKPNWDHKNLTYTITVYSNKLPRHVIDKIIAEAFNAWSAVADLTFTRLYSGDADIVIRFGSYDHSCPSGQSFDGPGGVLAHSDRNYIHFDESEKWQTGIDSDAINLHSVAVHEIGHILGLGASPLKKSIMNVSYNPRKVETRLQIDDIKVSKCLEFRSAFYKKKLFAFSNCSAFSICMARGPQMVEDTIKQQQHLPFPLRNQSKVVVASEMVHLPFPLRN